MPALGTPERPLAVAIVGSGPSGFYAAEALLKTPGLTVRVDLFDRLPCPYGLVRGGVAPDHQKIKSVKAVYERTAQDPRLRFFGAVKAGHDVTAAELAATHDAVIWAVGCESDRHMGVPGEDLAGSHSATEFVGWYNGHPDHRDRTFDLSCEAVAVVGVGNVAMDVTRILACDPEALAKTDIAGYALDALRLSKVKTVWLLGRRGPAEAAYSSGEIEEIGELATARLVVDPKEAALDAVSEPELSDPEVKKKVAYAQAAAAAPAAAKPREVRLRFRVSPVELLGQGGRVTAIKLERNTLVSDGRGGVKAVGSGEFETHPVGLVLRSVGYRGIPVPGVPFDEKSGHVPNEAGRVVSGGAALPGQFVVGWAKRGPSGLIGTNRADSVATVKALLDDWQAGKLPAAADASLDATLALLKKKGLRTISFADWQKLDALERERGAKTGKIREKFTRVEDMLAALAATA
ncbi:MAG: FAD-dependent oxidoreductase [Elusimicrobiota bacterium]|nr:FAD-dependent oxidoreductase [Elusimicrobiota bacterium]